MKGLTAKEAERRLNQYGFNELAEQKKTPIILKFIYFFYHFRNLLSPK